MNQWLLSARWPAALAAVFALAAAASPAAEITIKKGDGKATVLIDGQLFAEYVYKGYAKPIIYPIIGPTGVGMTRNYPMRENVDNEAHDHPHHKSLWYTHDDVNGVHFWLEDSGSERRGGLIVQRSMKIEGPTIITENDWMSPDGERVCSDTRVVTFGVRPCGRYIDFDITIHASDGDVVFGDTKEGTMGIRIHPMLRLTASPSRGNHTAKGHAINSEGVEGKQIWGKRADWVDYWGPINDDVVGIAIFDHPSNPRHPTWWHARDYGLVAANPFGVHNFENKPPGTGDMKIPAGESVRFRYRFLFHKGDYKQADIAGEYRKFAEG